MSFKNTLIAACCAGLSALSSRTDAQQLPRWELGVGLGLLTAPYYRGADKNFLYATPFPFIQYHGERFQFDQDGARGRLFKSDRVKLDISLGGGVPVPSGQNSARADMPDLDPTVEFGPSLHIRLWQKTGQHDAFYLKLPVRAVYALNTREIHHRGWAFSPYLEYATHDGGRDAPWILSLAAGPLFADRVYHDYFYEVLPAFATPERPEYHASGGYAGSRITLTAQKRFGRLWLGTALRYDTLRDAVFEDSPLVRTDNYFLAGVAVVWRIATSSTRVEVGD